MTQPAPARAERRGRQRCHDCGAAMRLFGIEAHRTIDQTNLLTYVCSQCDGLQTEPKRRGTLKALPWRAFDPETTRLLGSTFDEAWKSVEASLSLPPDKRHA